MKNLMKNRAIKKFDSSNNKIKKIVNFILEYRTLKHIPKGCLPYLRGPINESIAEHSFYVTIISWLLAKLEKANENKVIKMSLIHDLCEVRGGEKNLINKFYTSPNNEPKIVEEVSRDYNLEDFSLSQLVQEFSLEKTLEARIVRDADVLSQMLLEKECFDLGNQSASKWLHFSLMRLKTKTGRRLGKRLIEVESDEWWLEIDKRYLFKTKFL